MLVSAIRYGRKNLPKKGGRNAKLSTIHGTDWYALKLLPQNTFECSCMWEAETRRIRNCIVEV
jgi:hypothetical protein